MTFDDLRRLNPRDIGSWPALPKLGALFILLLLLVFAGYWFDWQNQLDDLARDRAKEQELRTAFLDKKKQAVNLEAYRKQLAEIEESFGEMLKQLPNKSEMEALLTVWAVACSSNCSVRPLRKRGPSSTRSCQSRSSFPAIITTSARSPATYRSFPALSP